MVSWFKKKIMLAILLNKPFLETSMKEFERGVTKSMFLEWQALLKNLIPFVPKDGHVLP